MFSLTPVSPLARLRSAGRAIRRDARLGVWEALLFEPSTVGGRRLYFTVMLSPLKSALICRPL